MLRLLKQLCGLKKQLLLLLPYSAGTAAAAVAAAAKFAVKAAFAFSQPVTATMPTRAAGTAIAPTPTAATHLRFQRQCRALLT